MNVTILDLIPDTCPPRDPYGDIRPEWRDGWNCCLDAVRDRLANLSLPERQLLILALARGAPC